MQIYIVTTAITSANQITDGIITQAKLDASAKLWALLGG